MGDEIYDLKREQRLSPGRDSRTLSEYRVLDESGKPNGSGTLEERLTAQDIPIVTLHTSLLDSPPGFARRLLSGAYHHTLGRLYHPQQASEAVSSIEEHIGQSMREASPGYAAEQSSGQTPNQDQTTQKRGRFLLRNGRETTHLALGVGATVLGYEVLPAASGLIYTVAVAAYEAAEPVIEVVSQQPSGVSAGLILGPAFAQRVLKSRNSRLSKVGIVATAAAGAAAGVALGEYGPEVLAGMRTLVQAYPLQFVTGALGAISPLVNHIYTPRTKRDSSIGGLAVQSAAGAGVGIGLSYLLPALNNLTEHASHVVLPGRSRALELLTVIGLTSLVYTSMSVFSPNSSRTTRAAVTLGAGITSGVAVHYLPAVVDAATFLFTRITPSLETMVHGLSTLGPALGAASGGAVASYTIHRFLSDGKRSKARTVGDVAHGAAMGVISFFYFGSDIASFVAENGIAFGISGAVIGTTTAFLKSRRLREGASSVFRYTGRTLANGAVSAAQYTAKTFHQALDAVTPSPEFVRQHRGVAAGSVVAIGTGLAGLAYTLEPVKDAVVHSISAGDVGLAALTVAAAASAGLVINNTVQAVRTYLYGHRKQRK